MKTAIISFLSGAVVAASVGYAFFMPEPEIITITEKSKPVVEYKYKYIDVKNDINKLRACYKSPIVLDYKINDYKMNVKAWDDCKATEQQIKLEVGRGNNIKFYIGAGIIGAGITYLLIK